VLSRVNDLVNLAAHKHVRRIVLRLMAEHADRMTPADVAAAFEGMAGCSSLRDILDGARDNGPIEPIADLNCPVRIAWGMNDRMLPFMRYGAPMLVAIPEAEFKLLPGVGHVPMIDDPLSIAYTILDFVESTVVS
jgi:pimeloyl-ACP methyl ester carboxylesterase